MANSKKSDSSVKIATFLFLLLVFIYGIIEAFLYKDYDPKNIAVDVIGYAIGHPTVPIILALIVSTVLKLFKHNFKRVFLVYLMVFTIPFYLLTGYQKYQENKDELYHNMTDQNRLSKIDTLSKKPIKNMQATECPNYTVLHIFGITKPVITYDMREYCQETTGKPCTDEYLESPTFQLSYCDVAALREEGAAKDQHTTTQAKSRAEIEFDKL